MKFKKRFKEFLICSFFVLEIACIAFCLVGGPLIMAYITGDPVWCLFYVALFLILVFSLMEVFR